MDLETYEDLLSHGECEWLEYKSFWYWNQNDKVIDEGWIEFIKDFCGLFNSLSPNYENKYLIFGYDEKKKESIDYNIDTCGNELEILSNLDSLKNEIIRKLKRRVKNFPPYKSSEDLEDLTSIFSLNEIEYNNKKQLIITIYNSPYLLKLKAELGKGFKADNVIIRGLKKSDKSPENIIADYDKQTQLISLSEANKINFFPEHETTISQIVEAFRKIKIPNADYYEDEKLKNLNTSLKFEIFKLKGEYVTPVSFLYFSKYTLQNKTHSFIIENKLFEPNEKIILLVDKFNKTGGKIDIKGLNDLFQNDFNNLETAYLEDFALDKLFQSFLDNDIFYKGEQLNKNFVKPYTNQSDTKTADLLISEWYSNEKEPVLLIKGSGGVGKTTLAKSFIERLYKYDEANILYINSHDIINEIMKYSLIEDIFDFYEILADTKKISNKFSKELLRLSSDMGSIFIVIDGIDEVIAKKGNDFNLNTFIDSIYMNYSGNLNKTKIILTCRDFYWDNWQNDKPRVIELKPFDEILARKYFSNAFKQDERRINESLKLASSFKTNNDNLYIPYILDMIRENILSWESENSQKINTNLLDIENNVDDFVVAKSCEREIKKLDNLDIDEQIRIFCKIAIRFDGVIFEESLKSILKKYNSEKNFEKFENHPLMIREGNNIVFRYDFFSSYFKCIYLSNFINNSDLEKLKEDDFSLITQYISFDNDFTKSLKQRLNEKTFEDLKMKLLLLVNDEIKVSFLDKEGIRELSSALFTLMLSLKDDFNKNQRTELLKEIFLKDNLIQNLTIINLHSKSKKIIFNFENLTFQYCYFENYENFGECDFNQKTKFINSIFKPKLIRKGINTALTRNNIDYSSCNMEGLDYLLVSKEYEFENESDEIRREVKRILNYFWSGSYFTRKLASEANNKFKNNYLTFQALIAMDVINKITVTTSQKRNDNAYIINEEFLDLRKIFEENNTCNEFEIIVKNITNSKLGIR